MITKEFKFENGQKVEEIITGFQGTITGTCFYITGCNQYLIIPKSVDNKKVEGSWYDEDRIKLLKDEPKEEIKRGRHRGADMEAPNRG